MQNEIAAGNRSPRRRGSGAQLVYETLRREVLDLSLRPGELLDETSLSERFSMSRSPIREALIRLTAEGLGSHFDPDILHLPEHGRSTSNLMGR